jgi:hypothetical protein
MVAEPYSSNRRQVSDLIPISNYDRIVADLIEEIIENYSPDTFDTLSPEIYFASTFPYRASVVSEFAMKILNSTMIQYCHGGKKKTHLEQSIFAEETTVDLARRGLLLKKMDKP